MNNIKSRLAAVLAVLVLSGCFGNTDPADPVTSTTARLWGTGTCESGDCDAYFEYWQQDSGVAWAPSTTELHPRGLPPGSEWPTYADVSNLQPDTEYKFRFCGKEAADSLFLCASSKAFRTEPPIEISDFTASFTAPNIVTLTWETSGGTVAEPIHIYGAFHEPGNGDFHRNVGYRTEHDNTSGLAFRVIPGTHRYVLELPTPTGKLTRIAEIEVPFPTSPIVTSPAASLYPVGLSNTIVSWPALPQGQYMSIRPPGQPRIDLVGQTSHIFTASYLSTVLGEGRHGISYFACIDMTGAYPAMDQAFCSLRSKKELVIGSARFLGPTRHFAATGGSVTLTWNATGDSTILTAPVALGGPQTVTGTSHPFTNLPVGIHNITLESCIATPADCANTEPVIAPVSGTVAEIATQLSVLLTYPAGAPVGAELAKILLDDEITLVPVYAPANGHIDGDEPLFEVGDPVLAGDTLIVQRTATAPHTQIVVRDDSFDLRHWTQDFSVYYPVRYDMPFTSHVRLGATMPLLITEDGGIWAAGEFADGSITHITGTNSGEVISPLAAPLLNIPDVPGPTPERLLPVKPFDQPALNNLSITKQETLIEAGQYIWFINGGSGQAVPGTNDNWNRIISFDRAGLNLSSTLYDDRFCVYHVPTNNAEVLGIDWDEVNDRIWYVESRVPLGETPVLAWFKPDELSCENFLDYSDSDGMPTASTTKYCLNPTDTNCIHTIPLEDSDGSGRHLYFAAHVKADSDVAWVAGYGSKNIARIDIASEDVDVLDSDPFSGRPDSPDEFYGSAPWQFLVDGDNLYFTEFLDGDIVKVNKVALAQDLASPQPTCKDTNGGDNPCMSEIHATNYIKEIGLHGNRLYFSGKEEFGYINLDTWTPGAIYNGLEERRDPERARIGPILSSDMSVGNDGQIIINDYAGRSIFRFYPINP